MWRAEQKIPTTLRSSDRNVKCFLFRGFGAESNHLCYLRQSMNMNNITQRFYNLGSVNVRVF